MPHDLRAIGGVDDSKELDRATRERLAAIAAAWKAGGSPDDVAQAALDAQTADTPRDWVVRDL